ncbi:hypothetical protein VTO42DRAFT_3940 [Malbranchea cinnamomea]
MLKTVDVTPTNPIDEPASVPGHADPMYDASYDDIEGLDSSDFNPAMQLALDLDAFIDTNSLREGENPTNTSIPSSFDFINPLPHNIIEEKCKRKLSSRVLDIFNTKL